MIDRGGIGDAVACFDRTPVNRPRAVFPRPSDGALKQGGSDARPPIGSRDDETVDRPDFRIIRLKGSERRAKATRAVPVRRRAPWPDLNPPDGRFAAIGDKPGRRAFADDGAHARLHGLPRATDEILARRAPKHAPAAPAAAARPHHRAEIVPSRLRQRLARDPCPARHGVTMSLCSASTPRAPPPAGARPFEGVRSKCRRASE